MNYVFYTHEDSTYLRTSNDRPTNMTGSVILAEVDSGVAILHRCNITRKVKSWADESGTFHEIYEVSKYKKFENYVGAISGLSERSSTIETAMCDTDAENEERLAEIELALCELDERG